MNNTIATKKGKKISLDSKFKLNLPIKIVIREKLKKHQAVYFSKNAEGCVILHFHKPTKDIFPIKPQIITVSGIKGKNGIRLRYRITVPARMRHIATFLRQKKIKIIDRGRYLELWPITERRR